MFFFSSTFDGTNGKDGVDGQTPYIGKNGNWWIGNEDTGVKAESTDFIYDNRGEGTILVAYVGNDYDVVIPEKTTRIDNGAFADNKVIYIFYFDIFQTPLSHTS